RPQAPAPTRPARDADPGEQGAKLHPGADALRVSDARDADPGEQGSKPPSHASPPACGRQPATLIQGNKERNADTARGLRDRVGPATLIQETKDRNRIGPGPTSWSATARPVTPMTQAGKASRSRGRSWSAPTVHGSAVRGDRAVPPRYLPREGRGDLSCGV